MLIATVEDVLRAINLRMTLSFAFSCNLADGILAKRRLEEAGLINDRWDAITPRGHEFIRRAEAGWPAEEMG
jgi:hypothetical protein